MFGALYLLLSAATSCSPVPGVDQLWKPSIRWVVIGELHGTNEIPTAFANLVCLASATGRPVTVTLEYSADWQNVIDRFLSSNGDTNSKAKLLKLPVWRAEMQDGRGSVAFLRLFESLRIMKHAGLIKAVVASDIHMTGSAQLTRDAVMAQMWRDAKAGENGIVLSLVGNIHAMRKPMALTTGVIMTAASLMPPGGTVTVNVVGDGGEAWICQQDGCRPHGFISQRSIVGITFSTDPDRRWDATYDLGVPTTAAPPAVKMPVAGPPQSNGFNDRQNTSRASRP